MNLHTLTLLVEPDVADSGSVARAVVTQQQRQSLPVRAQFQDGVTVRDGLVRYAEVAARISPYVEVVMLGHFAQADRVFCRTAIGEDPSQAYLHIRYGGGGMPWRFSVNFHLLVASRGDCDILWRVNRGKPSDVRLLFLLFADERDDRSHAD